MKNWVTDWNLLCISAALLAGGADASEDAAVEAAIQRQCPSAYAFHAAHKPSEPRPVVATMPALQGELNKMAEGDQSVRSGGFKVLSDQEKRDRLEEVDAKNLRRIKAIVEAHGLPTPALVGYDGVGSFWLLTQHATDYEFQDRVLTQIEMLGSESGVSAQQIAMLRDRILVRKGLPQRYGTQFQLMFEN